MTANINFSNQKLAEANQALAQSSLEAEQRRRHMEIILQNVSAGVISLDDHGRITTVNHFAEHLLGIERANFIGITYREAMPRSYALIFDRFIEELYISDKNLNRTPPQGNPESHQSLTADQVYQTGKRRRQPARLCSGL